MRLTRTQRASLLQPAGLRTRHLGPSKTSSTLRQAWEGKSTGLPALPKRNRKTGAESDARLLCVRTARCPRGPCGKRRPSEAAVTLLTGDRCITCLLWRLAYMPRRPAPPVVRTCAPIIPRDQAPSSSSTERAYPSLANSKEGAVEEWAQSFLLPSEQMGKRQRRKARSGSER